MASEGGPLYHIGLFFLIRNNQVPVVSKSNTVHFTNKVFVYKVINNFNLISNLMFPDHYGELIMLFGNRHLIL